MTEHREQIQLSDVLNIGGDSVPELDAVTSELLERGKYERVMILAGTEAGANRKPYAITKVEINFDDEHDLRRCVRMLRWSDDRLRARPEQLIAWEWDVTFREGMTIYFGVAWYDREFYARRKDAFLEPQHSAYYAMFGATQDRLKMTHTVLGESST
jgi:hypothetical protein